MGYVLILGFIVIGVAFLAILIFAFLPSKVMGDILDAAKKSPHPESDKIPAEGKSDI